jgi:dihydrofolate reductase
LIDPRIAIIVGKASNQVIGHNNTIPWHLSEDLKHFKATTLGHTMIMGRKTYESIGRPLPGRRTIVVSRSAQWSAPGVERADSLAAAIALAGDAKQIFVTGGAGIFREALAIAARLVVTEVNLSPPGDIVFPPIDPAQWQKIAGPTLTGANGIEYSIDTYQRR